MQQEQITKMRTCSHLLPDPGGEVVRECLDEIELLRKICVALIEADERGQGLPWQEAMKELYIALGYNAGETGEQCNPFS